MQPTSGVEVSTHSSLEDWLAVGIVLTAHAWTQDTQWKIVIKAKKQLTSEVREKPIGGVYFHLGL
jgi:hypothetical protein